MFYCQTNPNLTNPLTHLQFMNWFLQTMPIIQGWSQVWEPIFKKNIIILKGNFNLYIISQKRNKQTLFMVLTTRMFWFPHLIQSVKSNARLERGVRVMGSGRHGPDPLKFIAVMSPGQRTFSNIGDRWDPNVTLPCRMEMRSSLLYARNFYSSTVAPILASYTQSPRSSLCPVAVVALPTERWKRPARWNASILSWSMRCMNFLLLGFST